MLSLGTHYDCKDNCPPRTLEMEADGKMYHATYVVEDGCVQATCNGRKTTWTQVGGSEPVWVARMLLREILPIKGEAGPPSQ